MLKASKGAPCSKRSKEGLLGDVVEGVKIVVKLFGGLIVLW